MSRTARSVGMALKRAIDVATSATLLVALSPVIAVVAATVAVALGRPVLFRHRRPGRGAKPFTALKFRTMTDVRDATGQLLPDERRLTRTGRFLRRTSLDELPQLVNVLRGDMSLVGPRPLLEEYLPLYTPEQARRHEMRPGITGLAAVSGRNALDWGERFRLDVWYVDHWSLWLDAKILARTALMVLTGEGISQPGMATVEYFRGSASRRPSE